MRQQTLEELKGIWKLVLKLEKSAQPAMRKLLARIPFTQWVVFREVMTLLQTGGWDLETRAGKLALMYVGAMWSGAQNTLPLENGFSDLRDNEGRGARHKARTEPVLQGLCLSSMKTRYESTAPLLELESSDVSGMKQSHVRGELFMAGKAATTEEAIGLESKSLVNDRRSWPSTTPQEFSVNQLGLLHALMNCDEDRWSNLWVASLFRRHTVITKPGVRRAWYVVGVRSHSVALLELDGDDDADGLTWHINPHRQAVQVWVPITDLEEYRCHKHCLELQFTRKKAKVCVVLTSQEGETLVRCCCLNYIHLLRLQDLKPLAAALEMGLSRMTTQLAHVEAILDHVGIDGPERDRVVNLVHERIAKRSEKAKKADGDDEAEAKDDDADPVDDELREEIAEANPFMRTLPEEEVSFAFNAIPAGMALDEEECDAGLDEIAKNVADAPAPAPVKQKAAPASASLGLSSSSSASSSWLPASSSSSSGQPPLPPPGEDPTTLSTSSAVVVSDEAPVQPTAEEKGVMAMRAYSLRCPNLEDAAAPGASTLRLYPGARGSGKLRWQAKLPPGADKFEGKRSKSVTFSHPALKDKAKLECLQYLQRWEAAQVKALVQATTGS